MELESINTPKNNNKFLVNMNTKIAPANAINLFYIPLIIFINLLYLKKIKN